MVRPAPVNYFPGIFAAYFTIGLMIFIARRKAKDHIAIRALRSEDAATA